MTLKEKIAVWGFSIAGFLAMALLFNLILHYPLNSQSSEIDQMVAVLERNPNVDKEQLEIEKKLAKGEDIWMDHKKTLDQLPKFKPPKDNHLTEHQIHRLYQIVDHCWKEFRKFNQGYANRQTSGFGKAALIYFFGGIVLDLCTIEGQVQTQMTDEEFAWVRERMWETALFAVNRKIASGDVKEEEKEPLFRAQDQFCHMLGLVKDENNQVKTLPEKLKLSKIPRHNVQLFLQFKDEFRWRDVNFRNIEFDEQDIMRSAQVLPE